MNDFVKIEPVSPALVVGRLAAAREWARVRDFAADEIAKAANANGEPTHGLELIAVGDIFAPLPPAVYVVEGLIEASSLTLIGGYGASAKTWLAMDLGLAVATGATWHGAHECRRGLYVHLDYEQGRRESCRRVQALYKGNGYETEPAIELATFPSLYASDPAFEARITALAKGRTLITIDSLAVLSAGVDENTSAMRTSLDVFRRVGEATGCAFAVVLHAKKTSQSPTEIDPRELFRGSSAIFDAADQAIAVVKRGDRFVATQTKARHGKAVEPFAFRLVDVNGGVQLVRANVDDEPEEDVDPFDAATAAILDFVTKNPGCSRGRAVEHAKGKTNTKRAALDDLIEVGKITARDGANRAQLLYPAVPS